MAIDLCVIYKRTTMSEIKKKSLFVKIKSMVSLIIELFNSLPHNSDF